MRSAILQEQGSNSDLQQLLGNGQTASHAALPSPSRRASAAAPQSLELAPCVLELGSRLASPSPRRHVAERSGDAPVLPASSGAWAAQESRDGSGGR